MSSSWAQRDQIAIFQIRQGFNSFFIDLWQIDAKGCNDGEGSFLIVEM